MVQDALPNIKEGPGSNGSIVAAGGAGRSKTKRFRLRIDRGETLQAEAQSLCVHVESRSLAV